MKRIAVVDKDKCHPMDCGGYLCVRQCPVNRANTECIVQDVDTKIKIIEDTCIGCNICVKVCPFNAIQIINLPDQLNEDPIFRYGENQFALFSLPTPLFGKVVGTIGQNGIGKSTAIKILSSILKPNFGFVEKLGELNVGELKKKYPVNKEPESEKIDKETEEKNYKKLVEKYKGTEVQKFFEKLRDNKIKVAYKPQEVELIAKYHNGKIIDLLNKINEKSKKEFDNVLEKLNISAILDRDIKQISGGELQRVAIAATLLKNGNFYIFDEPSSYLDIKQRLKMSNVIKDLIPNSESKNNDKSFDLAADEKAVLVIEHDLIMLDYMIDLVNIMYGRTGAFGVVSGFKTANEGINVYLTGFLKEENMRFRDKEIKFEVRAPGEKKAGDILLSWKNVKTELGDFSFHSDHGELHRKEIVGVVGENGIGKTTFVKILAGLQKHSGEIKMDIYSSTGKVKISYKPQYLNNESTANVMGYLKDAIKYKTEIIVPLGLENLFEKNLNQLSGGELQRVEIAAALARDAEIVLLDEPSANLDVEQRLAVSKIIKTFAQNKGKSILVVDHDLLFVDYISDRLMVYSGEPSKHGEAKLMSMEDGMNDLLRRLEITLRRDGFSGRPRINKRDSVLDKKQKSENKYYYSA